MLRHTSSAEWWRISALTKHSLMSHFLLCTLPRRRAKKQWGEKSPPLLSAACLELLKFHDNFHD